MRVRFFAGIREAMGVEEMEVEARPEQCAADLFERLVAQQPALASWRESVRFAADCQYIDATVPLGQARELAILPPMQGG